MADGYDGTGIKLTDHIKVACRGFDSFRWPWFIDVLLH